MYSKRELKPLPMLSVRFSKSVARLRMPGLVALRRQTFTWTTLLKFYHVSFAELSRDLYHALADFRVAHMIASQFGYNDRSVHPQLATSVSLVGDGLPSAPISNCCKRRSRMCHSTRLFSSILSSCTLFQPAIRQIAISPPNR